MKIKTILIISGSLIIFGVIIWQALLFSGVPDPGAKNLNSAAAVLSCGLLVFREGLEAILVLSAITATVKRKQTRNYVKGITAGTMLGLAATIATWIIVVAILSDIDLPELDIQAATGLLAILVLLLVMNWFFHKVYWTGWITHHTNRGRRLIKSADKNTYRMFQGFVLLGFTAIYREGFEVVLFLQQLRLKNGNDIVLAGAAIGIFLTAVVAFLTFIAHEHLPYKKMLILTGVLLGIVLLVMVGESVQEMQQAGWIPTTPIDFSLPSWMGMWFAVFPNLQGLISQVSAVVIVIGSYMLAQYRNPVRSYR
jgi:high-affinity iron transporter